MCGICEKGNPKYLVTMNICGKITQFIICESCFLTSRHYYFIICKNCRNYHWALSTQIYLERGFVKGDKFTKLEDDECFICKKADNGKPFFNFIKV